MIRRGRAETAESRGCAVCRVREKMAALECRGPRRRQGFCCGPGRVRIRTSNYRGPWLLTCTSVPGVKKFILSLYYT
jgi:hypothetical protein